jgi:hypothetical protein
MVGVDIEGPPLNTQTNVYMRQQPRFERFNPSINNMAQPSASLYQTSVRWSPLMSVPTMAPEGKSLLYQDIETYSRINQSPRTMMDYAEAPYGMARGQNSLLTWKENKPEPLLKVTNEIEIQRQKQRESTRRF